MERVTLTRRKGTARLRFARRDKPVNILDEACIEQLEAHLDALEREPPELLLLESNLPGCFIAGADIDAIDAVTDAVQAERLAERGQAICRRIEDLSAIAIAVVNGAAMGGGLELALACDYLIAVAGDKTKMALPEIRLGIHPGFGGCVRLPRKIGWLKAVEMILTGRAVDAQKARRIGLADLVCHEEQVEAGIHHLHAKGKRHMPGVRPWWLRLWPLKALFFAQVKKRALARFRHLDIHDAYPAVPATVHLLSELVGMSEGLAYAREAESLGRLAVTPTCKNLIRVFRLGEALKHQPAVKRGRIYADGIKRVTVYGAGVMGSGIAWVAAKSAEVDMHDVSPEALAHGMQSLGRLSQRDQARLACIRPALDDSGLADAQVVIEAVLEDLDIKNRLWQGLEQQVSEDTLLLSNTSSLSIGAMQAVLKKPQRMAGMHFFNPAPKMPLVEVVAGNKTSRQTLNCVCALAARWDKYPVVVADRPGFLVNRCLMPYMAAALRLVEKGQKLAHVDGALKHFGMPLGALELADRVGLDICWHVGEHLSKALGAHRALPGWLERMVADGLLGAKSGAGFYTYAGEKRLAANDRLADYGLAAAMGAKPETDSDLGGDVAAMADADIVDACLLPMLAEALACLREKVVADAGHLDAAMVYGIGFPPFRGGLLHYFAGVAEKELKHRFKQAGIPVPVNLKEIYA